MANEIWLGADNIIKMEGRHDLLKLASACMRPDSVLAGGKPTAFAIVDAIRAGVTLTTGPASARRCVPL